MPDLDLDITWYKDPKGYRLIPARVPKLRPGQSALDVPSDEIAARIVRKGGALQSYRPLEIPNLVGRFISMATTENGVLKFVENFGPLTRSGLHGGGDVVPTVIDEAKRMSQPGATPSFSKLNASIITDRNEMRLKVWPACLLDALWLKLLQDGTRSRECEQCHEPFLVGVAVGRRKDARFCGDECRIKFNSLRRSRRP